MRLSRLPARCAIAATLLATSAVHAREPRELEPAPAAPPNATELLARPPEPTAPPSPEAIAAWLPGEPIAAGYKRDSRIREGLLIGGAATLGLVWFVNAYVAITLIEAEIIAESFTTTPTTPPDDVHPADFAPLIAPVVGPFIAIGTMRPSAAGTGLLLADGILQSAGLALLIGAALQDDVLMRTDVGMLKDVQVTPQLGDGSRGLGVSGRF